MEFHGYLQDAADYLKFNPYEAAITENVGFNTVPNMEAWKWYRWRKYDFPAQALQAASKVPFIGGHKLATQAALIQKVANNMQKIEEGYTYFKFRHWIYDDKEYIQLCDSLNEHDK